MIPALSSITEEQRLAAANRLRVARDATVPDLQWWNYDPCSEHSVITPGCQQCGIIFRRHQRVGIMWLYFMKNGLLADTVGSGKTAHAAGLFAMTKEAGEFDDKKALVVCRAAALMQWCTELNRMLPKINIQVASGTAKNRIDKYLQPWEIMVISQQMLLQDVEKLMNFHIGTIVVDDVDALRNRHNKTSWAIKKIAKNCDRVVIMTGTPLQKRLHELYSVLEPIGGREIFGSENSFKRRYIRSEKVTTYMPGGRKFYADKVVGYKNMALQVDEPVLTPTGWKRIGSLTVGDDIIDPEGSIAKVEKIYDHGIKPLRRVRFNDGAEVLCTDDHLWNLRNTKTNECKIISLGDFRKSFNSKLWAVPLMRPYDPETPLEPMVDPYIFGSSLGIGDLWILEEDRDKSALREVYQWSAANRLAFLQGLMDSGGGLSPKGNSVYFGFSPSEKLVDEVIEIVGSLGGYSSKVCKVKNKSTVEWKTAIHLNSNVFRDQENIDKQKLRIKTKLFSGVVPRTIVSIEDAQEDYVRCIKTTAPSGLFVTSGYIVTHNSEFTQKIAPLALRRTAADIDDVELPAINSVNVWLELHPAQKKKYDELRTGILKIVKAEGGTKIKRAKAFAALHYGAQICTGLAALGEADGPKTSIKLDWLEEKIVEGDLSDEKVVVFMYNKATIRAFQERLRKADVGFVTIWGDEPDKAVREQNRLKFWNDPECRVLMGTTSIEQSLNLQCARHLVNVDMIMNPARMEQLSGRIRRDGSAYKHVWVHNLLTSGTQEERYLPALQREQAVIDAVWGEQSQLFEALNPIQLMALITG